MIGMMEDLETLTIQQQNNSTDTIHLKWKKISESVPALWEASVCDNQACYTSLVDSGSMKLILPGDYGIVLLHITPHLNYGTAVIRYEVWDISTPLLRDTLTYILTVTATSGISEAEHKNAFSIFPNPVKENFSINTNMQNGFQFLITDVSGREIEKGISKASFVFVSAAHLPNGFYTVSVFIQNQIINKKQFLIQH